MNVADPQAVWYARLALSRDDDKLSTEAKVARQTGPAFNALSQLISATVAGAAIGWGLDSFEVTAGQGKVWGPVIGGVVGLAVFIYTASKIKTTQVPPPGNDPPPAP